MSENKSTSVESAKIALYGTIIVAVIGIITAAINSYSNYMSNRVQIELPINATQTVEARTLTETKSVVTPIPDTIKLLASNYVQNLANRNLITSTSGAVVWQSNEYSLEFDQKDSIGSQLLDTAPTDFVFYSNVEWASPDMEFTACGFTFRSNNDISNKYVSLLRRNGNAILWRYDAKVLTSELASTFTQGFNNANNGENRLVLIAQGSRFIFLVNDTVVYDMTDNFYATGYVGLVTGVGTNGNNTCTFRDSWLWAIK